MSYEQTKKLQRIFLTKFTFMKTFWAHANLHIAVKISKSSNLSLEGRIFYLCARKRARTKIFYKIKKLITFPTFYIPWMFPYHLNSWFYSCFKLGTFRAKGLDYSRFGAKGLVNSFTLHACKKMRVKNTFQHHFCNLWW